MTDIPSHLREAGFSDDEISQWATTTRQNLTAAGFSDDEVNDYFGMPKVPKAVPDPFIQRLDAGKKLTDFYGKLRTAISGTATQFGEQHPALAATARGAVEGFGDEPLGFDPEKERELYRHLGIPESMVPLVMSDPSAAVLKGGAAALDLISRTTNAGIRAIAEGAGELAQGFGMEQGKSESMKRDLNSLGQIAMLLAGPLHADVAGMQPPVRVARGPGGVQEAQSIGGLPKSQDFSSAGATLGHGDTTPALEGKLLDLYEQKGIHPSEVAHDAQSDVTVTQSMVSADKTDVPKAYGEPPPVPDILNERQPSSAGAAAAQPPAYTDAEKQILSKISIDEKEPAAKLTWDKVYTNTIDKLWPIQKAVKEIAPDLPAEDNPYQLARLFAGHVGKADHFLNRGTFDFGTYENNGPSLKEVLSPVAKDLNGFRAYAAAARALELEGRGIKSGFDFGDQPSAPPLISGGLDAARTVVVEGRDKYAKPLLDLVAYQNRVSAYLRDSGVLSEAGYKAMTEANQLYVPFTRVMGLDENARSFGGSTLQAKNPIKAIKGSARAIVDPVESVIRNTYAMIEMAEKNQIGTKLVDMLKSAQDGLPEAPKVAEPGAVRDTGRAGAMSEALGEVGVKKPDDLASALAHATEATKDGEIAILRDGKRETYNVDPDLARAMKGLDAQSMSLWERALAIPARTLRAGSVLTPQFWARHLLRDYLYAATTHDGGVFTPWDMAKGISGQIMKDESYWQWLKGGGGGASHAAMDRQYLQQNLRELTGQTGLMGRAWNVLADPNASMWQKTATAGTLPFDAIGKFAIDPLRTGTILAENASHLGAFKKSMSAAGARAAEGAPATDLRSQIIRSAWTSRDTAVDAARMGAAMKAYNQVIAFGNIKLQDTDRVVRAIKDNPIKSIALITGAITVPSVTLWSLNHDDPDYQEIPQWQKDMFFIIPVGSTAPSPLHIQDAQQKGVPPTNSAAYFLRIPKPWSMGMIFGSFVERLLDQFVDHKPEAFKDFGKKLWETSGPDFVPTGAAPIIEQFANRSTFTNRTLIPAAQEKFLPEYQYTPYTTETAKALGQIVGAFPGMDKLKMDNSGWGGVGRALTSPILIENYVRGWSGQLGMYALQAADAGLRKSGVLPDPPKPTSTLADIPVIQAFVVRYPSATTESIQSFQDEYIKNKSYFTTYQAMAADGNVAAMQHIQDMGGPLMWGQLDAIHGAITEHNQLIRDIWKNPTMPGDQKRQLIDQFYFNEIMMARQGMAMVHQIKEKAATTVPPPTLH